MKALLIFLVAAILLAATATTIDPDKVTGLVKRIVETVRERFRDLFSSSDEDDD